MVMRDRLDEACLSIDSVSGDIIDAKRFSTIIEMVLVLAAVSLVWKGTRTILDSGAAV